MGGDELSGSLKVKIWSTQARTPYEQRVVPNREGKGKLVMKVLDIDIKPYVAAGASA